MTTPDEPWTIGRLLSWTKDYLERQGVENPRLEAEVLLAAARGCKRIELYVAFDEQPPEATRAAFRDLVRRRAAGTPVAYLVGHREFYSLDFEVTPDVLIPRPETELLVVALLDYVKKLGAGDWGLGIGEVSEATPARSPKPQAPVSVADVGTGSGILAVCAAKYVPRSRVTAIDISPAALVIARRNADRHGVAGRIDFVESDLFAALPSATRFDAIVSNPPYVSTAEMASLPKDVRDYEPHVALEAGEQGTAVIEPLVEQAAERLLPGGKLMIEVSPMIADRVEQLLREQAGFRLDDTIRDLAGHPRAVRATRKSQPE